MPKILMLMAEGFEEAEAVITADFLRRLGFDLETASLTSSLDVKGAHGISVKADRLLMDVKDQIPAALVLPGGMPGSATLRDDKDVIELIKNTNAAGSVVAAICAAPIALDTAGILKGRTITSHPSVAASFKDSKHSGARAERDHNIVTGLGPGASFDFAAKVAEALGKGREAAKLLADMFVPSPF